MAILKSDIFHCSDSFERGHQFNSISDRTKLQYIKNIKEPNIPCRLGENKTKKLYVSPEIWTKDFRQSIGGHFIFGH